MAKKADGLKGRIKKLYLSHGRALIGALLTSFGVLLLLFPFIYRYQVKQKMLERDLYVASLENFLIAQPRYDHGPIKADPKILDPSQFKGKLPIRVIVPRIEINLPVTPAEVIDDVWKIPEETAAFGLGSAPPEDKGNSVIFAHARRGMFYSLRDIKDGDEIYVLTPERWFSYKVKEIKTVLPNQVEVIAPTSDRTLTLYTCSGFADSKRLVVVAKPV